MRAFIGISIPEEIRKIYSKICRPLRDSADISFVRPDKMHITLAFFQDISKDKLPVIENIFNEMHRSQFEISCDSIGQFKRRGIPSTVFINISSIELAEYAEKLHKKLDEAGISYDKKPFVPHITMGRIKEMNNEDTYFKTYKGISKNFEPLSFYADSVHLFSSNMVIYKKEVSHTFDLVEDLFEI